MLKKVKLIFTGGRREKLQRDQHLHRKHLTRTRGKESHIKIPSIVPVVLKVPLNAIYEEVLDVVESCHPTVDPETIRIAVKDGRMN